MELPIERPTKFEVVVNLKTPKDIGVEPPTAILQDYDVLADGKVVGGRPLSLGS